MEEPCTCPSRSSDGVLPAGTLGTVPATGPKPSPRPPGALVQRQGMSVAEVRKAPVACPSLAQPAPSWAGSLAGRQVWVRLAQCRTASRQELCQFGPLSRAGALPHWRRTQLRPSRALSACGWAASAFPEEARFPTYCSLGFKAEALSASCRSRQLRLSWGGGGRPHTQGQAPTSCTRLCWGREC